ncbi:MAG: hypothetical protein LBD14_00235 [Puniceicoccales bacterium]|jgi:hypothetical protein|nr:hypothetical protein [Puniceicoccales bacterium]
MIHEHSHRKSRKWHIVLLSGILITGTVFPILPRGFDVASKLEQEGGTKGGRLSPVLPFKEAKPTEIAGTLERERLRREASRAATSKEPR